MSLLVFEDVLYFLLYSISLMHPHYTVQRFTFSIRCCPIADTHDIGVDAETFLQTHTAWICIPMVFFPDGQRDMLFDSVSQSLGRSAYIPSITPVLELKNNIAKF